MGVVHRDSGNPVPARGEGNGRDATVCLWELEDKLLGHRHRWVRWGWLGLPAVTCRGCARLPYADLGNVAPHGTDLQAHVGRGL